MPPSESRHLRQQGPVVALPAAALLLALAAGLGGCSTPGPVVPPPPSVAVVVSRDLEAAAVYQVGNDRSVLTRADAYLARSGVAGRRAVEQELLCLISRPGLPDGGKDYVIRAMQQVGSGASVPALSLLMEDPKWGLIALNSLAGIPGSEADLALLRALSEARGERLLALVGIVGQRRVDASVPVLTGLLGMENSEVPEAALKALGLVGTPQAVMTLLQTPVQPLLLKAKIAALVESMSRAAQTGGLSPALRTQMASSCRSLIAGEWPVGLKLSCLKTLQQCEGAPAAVVVVGALRSQDAEFAAGAVAVALEFPSETLRTELLKAWPALAPSLRVALLGGFASTKDPQTRPLAISLLETRDPGLVTAAVRALGQVGTVQDFDRLLVVVKAGNEQSAEAAAAIARIADPAVDKLVRERLAAAGPAEASVLFDIAVARGDRQAFEIGCGLIEEGAVKDKGLRSAALEAVAAQARPADMPRLTGLLLSLSDPVELRILVRSLQALAPVHENSTEASSMLLLAARDADALHRKALRLVLSTLDTPEAVSYLSSSLSRGTEEEWRDQLRVLGESRQLAHFDTLWSELPKVPSGPDRVLVLTGLVNLVTQSRPVDGLKRAEACESLWPLLSRDEDRQAVLRTLETLKPEAAKRLRAKVGL